MDIAKAGANLHLLTLKLTAHSLKAYCLLQLDVNVVFTTRMRFPLPAWCCSTSSLASNEHVMSEALNQQLSPMVTVLIN